MIYRYNNFGFLDSRLYPEVLSPEYDSVVDSSSYRPDAENTRHFLLSGSGTCSTPLYDENPDSVSTTELLLRQGKLDKGEISQLILQKKADYQESISEHKKELALEEVKKLNEARQDYLDKATGFKGQPVTS